MCACEHPHSLRLIYYYYQSYLCACCVCECGHAHACDCDHEYVCVCECLCNFLKGRGVYVCKRDCEFAYMGEYWYVYVDVLKFVCVCVSFCVRE